MRKILTKLCTYLLSTAKYFDERWCLFDRLASNQYSHANHHGIGTAIGHFHAESSYLQIDRTHSTEMQCPGLESHIQTTITIYLLNTSHNLYVLNIETISTIKKIMCRQSEAISVRKWNARRYE